MLATMNGTAKSSVKLMEKTYGSRHTHILPSHKEHTATQLWALAWATHVTKQKGNDQQLFVAKDKRSYTHPVLRVLVNKQLDFGKPISTHAYLPNTPKAQNLFKAWLLRTARQKNN